MGRQERAHRVPQPFRRKIHFGADDVWSYKIGEAWAVIRTPDCSHTYRVDLSDLCMESWDELERATWKGYWRGITPARVRQYIEWHLRTPPDLGEPDAYIHPRWPSRARWHLFQNCSHLPHSPKQLHDPKKVSHDEIKKILTGSPTAENLCTSCMYRVQVPPQPEPPPFDVRSAFRGVVLMGRATPEETMSARRAGLITSEKSGTPIRTTFGHTTIEGLRARIAKVSTECLGELGTACGEESRSPLNDGGEVLDALGILDLHGNLTELGRAVVLVHQSDRKEMQS